MATGGDHEQQGQGGANAQKLRAAAHKANRFSREEIQGSYRVPHKASTQLTSDGNIYLVGGYRLENGEIQALRECVSLNDSLEVT